MIPFKDGTSAVVVPDVTEFKFKISYGNNQIEDAKDFQIKSYFGKLSLVPFHYTLVYNRETYKLICKDFKEFTYLEIKVAGEEDSARYRHVFKKPEEISVPILNNLGKVYNFRFNYIHTESQHTLFIKFKEETYPIHIVVGHDGKYKLAHKLHFEENGLYIINA